VIGIVEHCSLHGGEAQCIHLLPLVHCRVAFCRERGVALSLQPPDIGFDDEGVPEWPDDSEDEGSDVDDEGEEGEAEAAGEPQGVTHGGAGRGGGGAAAGASLGADPE